MSVASSQGRVCSLPGHVTGRASLERQRGADHGHQARGQTRNPHVLPAASSRSAGRQAECRQAGQQRLWAHRGRLSLPEIFRGGSWLRFWMLNGKRLCLGFRSRCLRCRMDTSAGLALRTRQEDVGPTGQTEPGWWQPCQRDLELGILMEMARRKHTTGAAGAEAGVPAARTELPLCPWVPDQSQALLQLGASRTTSPWDSRSCTDPLPCSHSFRVDSQPPSSPSRAALHHQPRPDPAGEERNESKGN